MSKTLAGALRPGGCVITEASVWQPVLEGAPRATALGVVEAVLADLASDRARRAKGRLDPFVAVLFAEASRVLDRPSLMTQAVERLRATTRAAAGRPPRGVGLYGGWCGVAWLASWLNSQLASRPNGQPGPPTLAPDEPQCAVFDETVLRALDSWDTGTQPFDLLSGLVGIGVYALDRYPNGSADRMLHAVASLLWDASERCDGGVTWITPDSVLPASFREQSGGRACNLGVAHGVPGVLALLGHLCQKEIDLERTSQLADLATRWLLRQQLPRGAGARYPHWNFPHTTGSAGRMAWCYGGLGMSIAVLVAARALQHEAAEKTAVQMAVMESEREWKQTGVADACLCHGAAGNALIFQRLYCATGDQRFRYAAVEWFKGTLRMCAPGQGIGGYRFFDGQRKIDDAGFLTGSAGVALALLAAVSDVAPSWDRLLMTEISS